MGIPALPATSYALLGLLVFRDPESGGLTGYELKQRADNTLRYYWVSPAMSQIYTELKRLEKHGLVRSDPSVKGLKTSYTITEKGEVSLRKWLFDSDPGFPVLKHPIALRLLMGRLTTPERLQAMLEHHLADLAARRSELQGVREMLGDEHAARYASLVADWGLDYYDSEERIVRSLMNRLNQLDD